jgi:hypothetical protein
VPPPGQPLGDSPDGRRNRGQPDIRDQSETQQHNSDGKGIGILNALFRQKVE